MKKKDLLKILKEGVSISANNVLSASSGKAESADGTNVSSAQGVGAESSSNAGGSGSYGKSESASFQNADSITFGDSESVNLTNVLSEPGSVDIKVGTGGDITITSDSPGDDEKAMEFGKSLWEQNKDQTVTVQDSSGQSIDMSSTGVQAVQEEENQVINFKSTKNLDTTIQQAEKIKQKNPKATVNAKSVDGDEFSIGNETNEEIDLSITEIMSIIEENSNPIMKKGDFLNEVKRIIEEDMERSVRGDIEGGRNPYSQKLGDELTKRFAQEHFEEIKQNLRNRGVDQVNLPQVQRLLMGAVTGAMQLEQSHKEELENLAVELIKSEYNIPEDAIDFEVNLVEPGRVNPRAISFEKRDMPKPEGYSDEELESEVKKRRIINSMTHGAARKSQNLYHMARERVEDLDPDLINHYNNLMAANDAMYWMLDDRTISSMGRMSSEHAGNVRIDYSGEKPKLIAQGISFPILLHELGKGALELISSWGLHSDRNVAQYVTGQVDHLDAETNDIRFGPKLWEKFMESLDIDDLDIKSQIWEEIVLLPADEFNDLTKRIFNGEQSAKNDIKDIANGIKHEIGQEDMEDALSQYSDDEPTPEVAGDDDMEDDVLKGLLSQEPEEGGYETWSQSQLQDALDKAFDDGDMDRVREIGQYLR